MSAVDSQWPKSVPRLDHQNSRSAFDTSAASNNDAVLAEASRSNNSPRAKMGVAAAAWTLLVSAASNIAEALGLSVVSARYSGSDMFSLCELIAALNVE